MFMELPVSGLHRLFHTTPSLLSLSAKAPTSLESVTEDAHTYDLLYPEPSTLRQTQHHAYPLKNGDPSLAALAATSHDDCGGLDIQNPQGVRIIIAQDGNVLAQQPRVLYDSQPYLPSPLVRQAHTPRVPEDGNQPGDLQRIGGRRRITSMHEAQTVANLGHERRSSLAQSLRSSPTSPISPGSPELEFRSAFSNPKLQRSGLRYIASGGESIQSRVIRERLEETEALLGCMFGSTGLPMVCSTKLHIKPAGSSGVATDEARSPVVLDIITSRAIPRKRTPLTRSTTLDELHSFPTSGAPETPDQTTSRSNQTTVIVTRIFNIDLATPLPRTNHSALVRLDSELTVRVEDYQTEEKPTVAAESEKTKQLKPPTYAIAIILQLPADRHRSFMPPVHGTPTSGNNQDRLFQSPKKIGNWSWEELPPNEILKESDRDVENVIEHWNMLNRVASSLEVVAKSKIRELLGNEEAASARLPVQIPIKADMYANVKPKQQKQTSQRTVQLASRALQQCDLVQKEVEMARKRVALALKIRKAIAGQGRWGVWREEARWIERWAGRREQNFFFFNLLTAFLGTHTEWLDMLGPSWSRRRSTKQVHQSRREVSIIQHRTVIVSTEKMAARRLIFLLSAFLPSTYVGPIQEEISRPRSSWSNAGYSDSPPSAVSGLRHRSLRRTINTRQRGSRLASGVKPHARGVSFSGPDLPFFQGLNGHVEQGVQQHTRRASDARSIRSLPLPISSSELTRKSSSTTTGSAVHDTAVPVPHFTSFSPDLLLGTSAEARPGSRGSFASLSLKHTLTRSEGTDHSNTSAESYSPRGWGSMISSFWSARRGSSTDESDVLSSPDGLGISGIPRDRRGSRRVGKLAQMVEEVDKHPESQAIVQNISKPAQGPTSVPILQDQLNILPEHSTPAKNIPERPRNDQFPMKLSIDENDGVVDIDLPMPNSYSSSFASSMSSPKATHTGASSLNDGSLYGRNSSHEAFASSSEPPPDVAGWLKGYHQDFALQAVRPYKELKEDIKRSMRMEPAQTLSQPTRDSTPTPWTEVCTTLVADAQNFSVTRLSLRRRPAPVSADSQSSLDNAPRIEEDFQSEPIMDLDPTLIDAVERVLAQSTHSSRTHSRSHSRTTSPSRHHDEAPALEVPRSECRKLVLGALEQVARSVGEEQMGRERVVGRDVRGPPGAGSVDSTLREGVRRWLNVGG